MKLWRVTKAENRNGPLWQALSKLYMRFRIRSSSLDSIESGKMSVPI